jgi:hypothetical protein
VESSEPVIFKRSKINECKYFKMSTLFVDRIVPRYGTATTILAPTCSDPVTSSDPVNLQSYQAYVASPTTTHAYTSSSFSSSFSNVGNQASLDCIIQQLGNVVTLTWLSATITGADSSASLTGILAAYPSLLPNGTTAGNVYYVDNSGTHAGIIYITGSGNGLIRSDAENGYFVEPTSYTLLEGSLSWPMVNLA